MEALNLITQNQNLPQTTSTHHQFEHTKTMEDDPNAPCSYRWHPPPLVKQEKPQEPIKIENLNKMWIQKFTKPIWRKNQRT